MMTFIRLSLIALLLSGCILPVYPPTPSPTPTPVPPEIETGPISVLIVEQDSDRRNSEYIQYLNSMQSPLIRSYMDQRGKKVGGADWLVLDVDSDVRHLPAFWQDAFNQSRDSLPWILITNGKSGFAGPLPRTEAETLSLLKKYGGE
jgi:hypothetical protein